MKIKLIIIGSVTPELRHFWHGQMSPGQMFHGHGQFSKIGQSEWDIDC